MIGVPASQPSGSALLAVAQWVMGLVQGPAATTLAVLAIAGVGLMMLNGRLAVRRGLTVVMGCFILFGSTSIARGLFASATRMADSDIPAAVPAMQLASPITEATRPPAQIADPYAGASVAR